MAPKQVRLPLSRRAVDEGWTVRQTQNEARAATEAQEQSPTKSQQAPKHPRNQAVEAQLRAAIGAPVKVTQKKGRGKIEVRFHSFEELERLIEIFSTLNDAQ